MYTFHDLCSEDDIKVMSKASLQLSEEYLFLGDLLKPWKVEKQGTNGSVDFFFFFHSIHTYWAIPLLGVQDSGVKRTGQFL